MQGAIPLNEFVKRRRKLIDMMAPNSVAIIPGARASRRNRDVYYPFRQDSDFHYLTGFNEPDSLLVLVPGRKHGEVVLFCPERDPVAEQWDGERLGPDRAVQILGVDDAFPEADLDDIVPGFLEGNERIYISLGEHPEFDNQLLSWVSAIRKRDAAGTQTPGEFVELKHLLHELRLFKSPRELKLMRQAAQITCDAHKRAMGACQPGLYESQLEAELVYEFMRQGARHPAYPSIVGSGPNACVLHYLDNNRQIERGDLVLIDAGCELESYAADVTRTFPASGRFNKAQREIYQIVLAANQAAIDACVQGADFNAPHAAAIQAMVEGLLALGLLQGSVEQVLENEDYKQYCPHRTSHWLGLDVHDVGDYRIDESWRELEPGMVLTVEPGIYIPVDPQASDAPKKYRGIGVRIEDDVLVTKTGPEVLSTSMPKQVSEIEALVGAAVQSATPAKARAV